ncbi:microtubule-associated protein RP/EB family member 1-like isoform X2 [Drosophila grimshawi]|uniref:microtubule-associated protein RP/EB family member 1-like isoform X2 n=1 Tax=Drosophila grimshawi TaxID=7222 RepID=UPI001C933640|nr:microtubule-associated protein RP/EB family member 1-like isoform X2 [Drosophila grimshawi]
MGNEYRIAKNVVLTRNSKEQFSKIKILNWVNETLESNLSRIEDLCTGAAYCNLMDILFPNLIQMRNVKFMGNQKIDYIKNFKLLQQGFNKLQVNVSFDIQELIKGNYRENYQFANWFKVFYDRNFESICKNYCAKKARGYQEIGMAISN